MKNYHFLSLLSIALLASSCTINVEINTSNSIDGSSLLTSETNSKNSESTSKESSESSSSKHSDDSIENSSSESSLNSSSETSSNETSNSISSEGNSSSSSNEESSSSSSENSSSETNSSSSSESSNFSSSESNQPSSSESNQPSSSEENTGTSSESNTSSSSQQDSNTESSETVMNPHKGERLPCGYEYIAMPDNIKQPLSLENNKYYDYDCSYQVPQDWKYIYGNNSTEGDFYQAYNDNIALKFADRNRGIQTPAFNSTNKLEIRLNITEYHRGDDRPPKGNKPETFEIYGFDENQNIVYQNQYTPFKNGLKYDKKNRPPFDIKIYIEDCPKMRYAEVRFNDLIYSKESTPKYINVGATTLTICSHNF